MVKIHFLKKIVFCLHLFFIFALQNKIVRTQSDSLFVDWLKKDIKISGQWFLGYQYLDDANQSLSQFTLKRGYLTFKKQFNKTLSVRFTQDITLDKEGSDAGNVEIRLKYCYLKIKPQMSFLHNSYFELGLIHRPWLDYEQKINSYRVQGKMFLERYKLMNSADFGITFISPLGGKIKHNKKVIYTADKGKFGSIALGIYNGAGYHAIENNKNKTLEGRLCVRPFYRKLPGLLLNYSFIYGKGNIVQAPDFHVNSFFTSYESKYFIATAQYYFGKGDSDGKMINESNFEAYSNQGYSIFGELFLLHRKVSLFGRYDYFLSQQATDIEHRTYIGGLAYHFLKGSKFLLETDYTDKNGAIYKIYEVAIEIRF